MTSPIRPVSDEHRHEPADYEVDGRKPKRKRKAKVKPANQEQQP